MLAPTLLTDARQLDAFSCGEVVLDDRLKKRARANQASGASRTYVVAEDGGRVIGYYCLSSGAIAAAARMAVRSRASWRSPRATATR